MLNESLALVWVGSFPAVLPCIAVLADAAALTTLSPAAAVPRARLDGTVRPPEALDADTLACAAQFPWPAAPGAGAGRRLFLPTVLAAVAELNFLVMNWFKP